MEANRARRTGHRKQSKSQMSPRSRRLLCFCTPILMIILGIAIGISFLMLHLNKKTAEASKPIQPEITDDEYGWINYVVDHDQGVPELDLKELPAWR